MFFKHVKTLLFKQALNCKPYSLYLVILSNVSFFIVQRLRTGSPGFGKSIYIIIIYDYMLFYFNKNR